MAYLHELEWLDTDSVTPFKMLNLCQTAGTARDQYRYPTTRF